MAFFTIITITQRDMQQCSIQSMTRTFATVLPSTDGYTVVYRHNHNGNVDNLPRQPWTRAYESQVCRYRHLAMGDGLGCNRDYSELLRENRSAECPRRPKYKKYVEMFLVSGTIRKKIITGSTFKLPLWWRLARRFCSLTPVN